MISPASTEDAVTDLEGQRFRQPDLAAGPLPGPGAGELVEESLGGAQGKTVNIGARQ